MASASSNLRTDGLVQFRRAVHRIFFDSSDPSEVVIFMLATASRCVALFVSFGAR